MGTKEYHASKSREYYLRNSQDPEWLKLRADQKSARRREKKAEAVKQFGRHCLRCAEHYSDCVFEFHHLDPAEKEYTPSRLFGLKDSTIEAELKKCVMLCANCHRIVHMEDKYAAHAKRYE